MLSPRWPIAGSCGSRRSICRVVSSYKTSFAPGTSFSVHLGASAKASSAVQLLFIMTPDHDPEFGLAVCLAKATPPTKKNATIQITGKFILIMPPPECSTSTTLDVSTTAEHVDIKLACPTNLASQKIKAFKLLPTQFHI